MVERRARIVRTFALQRSLRRVEDLIRLAGRDIGDGRRRAGLRRSLLGADRIGPLAP